MRATNTTLGIDIGGTKTALALVDPAGEAHLIARLPTEPARGAGGMLAAAAQAAREVLGDALGGATAVGVCVAGQVSPDGILLGAPNLGWDGAPVAALARHQFGRPAVVLNDVHAAAVAEWGAGAGLGVDDLVVLYLGTGVGGGVIVGGRLLTGATGTLGELGHVTLVAGGRRCHCRSSGCIEAYVSGWALADRTRDAVAADPQAGAAILAAANGDAAAITGRTLAAAHRAGDPLARHLVAETGALLGAAAVGLVNGWNPSRLVLGGGVIDGLPELVDAAARAVRDHALPVAAEAARVVRAGLGSNAPAVGAALWAQQP